MNLDTEAGNIRTLSIKLNNSIKAFLADPRIKTKKRVVDDLTPIHVETESIVHKLNDALVIFDANPAGAHTVHFGGKRSKSKKSKKSKKTKKSKKSKKTTKK